MYLAISCFSPNDNRINGFRFWRWSTERPSLRFWRASNFRSHPEICLVKINHSLLLSCDHVRIVDNIPLEALKFLMPNISAYSNAFWRTTFELNWRPSASASSNNSEIFCSISGKAELRFLKAWLILFPSGELAGEGIAIWFDLNMSTMWVTLDGQPGAWGIEVCVWTLGTLWGGDGGNGVSGSPRLIMSKHST